MKLLNKPPFRRGDVVRCVSAWGDMLKAGTVWSVVSVKMEYGVWFLDIGDGEGTGWWADRFVKVSEENNSEATQCSSGQAGTEV